MSLLSIRTLAPIRGVPVVYVDLHNSTGMSPLTEDSERQMKQRWMAMYREHPRFAMIVDLRHLSVLDAFVVVPQAVKLLKASRALSAAQITLTGVIMSPVAQPLLHAVTQLYPPVRPYVSGASMEEINTQLAEFIDREEINTDLSSSSTALPMRKN